MDVATHLLVPYAAALAALGFWRRGAEGDARRASWAAAFGAAGAAPDLDGLVDPLSERWHALYWLQHRGASHALVGAPVFALLLVLALALLARRWPRLFGLFAWRPALAGAAVLGSWTHLLLDSVTYAGVPLWWPFAFGRVAVGPFHWLVFWLLPVSALALGLHAFGRLSRRRVVAAGALVVAALVVVAGVRAATFPRDEPEGAQVHARSSPLEWTVLVPHANGSWEGYVTRLGERGESAWYVPAEPPEARDAVARAKGTDAWRGFLMGSFGPVVVQATPAGEGAWRVVLLDVAQRHEATHDPDWTPVEPFEEWGYVQLLVTEERVEVEHAGW